MSQELEASDPFSRAYSAIRSDLVTGRRKPGSQIRVDETARSLRISPTPVREALAMLTGERLVRGTRRQGYFVPQPTASDLVELYTLSEMHLLAAVWLQSAGQRSRAVEVELCGPRPPLARVFLAILAGAGVPALLDSGALVLERLAPARLAEVSDVTEMERDEVVQLLHDGRFSTLARLIRVYHRTQRAKAVEIAQAIAASGPRRRDEYFRDML